MFKSEQIKNTANIYFYSSGELIKLRALKFKHLKINNIEHIFKQMFLTKNHQIFTHKKSTPTLDFDWLLSDRESASNWAVKSFKKCSIHSRPEEVRVSPAARWLLHLADQSLEPSLSSSDTV